MVFDLLDRRIRRAFSDAALQYDVLANLHKEIGRELMGKIKPAQDCRRILDIGMGTGWLTNRLSLSFPGAQVIGLDFASGMVERAKKYSRDNEGFGIVQADAGALPFKDDVFDIIISNLTYQWVADLEQAFRLCYSVLNQEGTFCFTMFGYHTFAELFAALTYAGDQHRPGNGCAWPRLANREQITTALARGGFKNIKASDERIKAHFPDMMALVKWIKGIGANALPKDMFIGKELLGRADEYYNNHFRDRLGIYATLEVIWAEATK